MQKKIDHISLCDIDDCNQQLMGKLDNNDDDNYFVYIGECCVGVMQH